MQLSLKQKALLQTLVVFVLAIASVAAATFITMYLSPKVLGYTLGIGLFGYIVYIFYSITLSRLRHQETLKEFNKLI